MKIIFDKLNDDQKYSISADEIRSLFKVIPDLTNKVKIVHVQGQEPNKSRFPRPVRFELLGAKLSISAKGLNKESIIHEILVELISQNSNDISLRPASYRALTKKQMHKIEEIILTIMSRFNEQKE